MAESKEEKIAKSWQAFWKPVAGGLVTLMAAAALFLSHSNDQSCELKYNDLDKRLSAIEQSFDKRTSLVETNVTNLQTNQAALSSKLEKILESVNTIQVDIAKLVVVMDNTRIKK